MSHFSVCVIVPDDGVVNNIHANNLEDHLIPVLAPFDEQTEEEKYREFEDRTEEAKADFENDTMRVVRFPDAASTPFTMMLSTSPSSLRRTGSMRSARTGIERANSRRRSPKHWSW